MNSDPTATPRDPDHIDLTLSGGGFRAALFHLGVIGFLEHHGWLGRVRTISSVSGGSVLAAYLVIHWAEIKGTRAAFRERAREFAEWIAKTDVSGRVLKKSVWQFLRLMPLNSECLIQEYGEVLRREKNGRSFRWDELASSIGVELHVLATHLNTGRAGAFSAEGFYVPKAGSDDRFQKEVNALVAFAEGANIRSQEMARAVAASSAFPPVFSPVALDQGKKEHFLTDGGAYDNSGIKFVTDLYSRRGWKGSDNRLVIVSDASRAFQTGLTQRYGSLLELGSRVIDTQGARIAREDVIAARQFFDNLQVPVLHVSILDSIEEFTGKPATHTTLVQERLRTIRTELDRFAPEEIFALYRHGYLSMQQRCLTSGDREGIDWTPIDGSTPPRGRHPPVGQERRLLEAALAESHIVRKWSAFGAWLLRRLIVAVVAFVLVGLAVLGLGYFVGRSSLHPAPKGGLRVTDVAGEVLPKKERKQFIENAVIKADFHFPVDVPIEAMTTLFFECERPGCRTPDKPEAMGATIKVQVILPKLTATTTLKVRPRTAPSTAGTDAFTFVYAWNPGRSPKEQILDGTSDQTADVGYEEFSVSIQPGGAVVIVAQYDESPFARSTLDGFPEDRQTGWIHVEVSDYATKRRPQYFFAVAAEADTHGQISFKSYEVWPGDDQPYLKPLDIAPVIADARIPTEWPASCRNAQIAILDKRLSPSNDRKRDLDALDQARKASTAAREHGSIEKVYETDKKVKELEKRETFATGTQRLLDHLREKADNWVCIGHRVESASRDMAYILSAKPGQ